jgi:hypothetical protein
LDLEEKAAFKALFPELFPKLTEFWEKLNGQKIREIRGFPKTSVLGKAHYAIVSVVLETGKILAVEPVPKPGWF